MVLAFSDNALFGDLIINKAAKISEVIHKTYVDVYEGGTEAAAVTEVGMVATMVRPPLEPKNVFHMIVDHPFFFVIRDDSSGDNLFMGAIENPGK
jgi:serpin B